MSAARGSRAVGFAPIATESARILVLGSLPGRRSLDEGRYYAQPRNAFWEIMGRLFGATAELPYDERLARLRAHGVAVWDVVAAAERSGSLDSAIVGSSVVVNDFVTFFARYSGIELVCFNGNTAAALYRRRVLPTLPEAAAELPTRLLPSTSPAYATLTFEQKLERWSAAFGVSPLRGAARVPAARASRRDPVLRRRE